MTSFGYQILALRSADFHADFRGNSFWSGNLGGMKALNSNPIRNSLWSLLVLGSVLVAALVAQNVHSGPAPSKELSLVKDAYARLTAEPDPCAAYTQALEKEKPLLEKVIDPERDAALEYEFPNAKAAATALKWIRKRPGPSASAREVIVGLRNLPQQDWVRLPVALLKDLHEGRLQLCEQAKTLTWLKTLLLQPARPESTLRLTASQQRELKSEVRRFARDLKAGGSPELLYLEAALTVLEWSTEARLHRFPTQTLENLKALRKDIMKARSEVMVFTPPFPHMTFVDRVRLTLWKLAGRQEKIEEYTYRYANLTPSREELERLNEFDARYIQALTRAGI